MCWVDGTNHGQLMLYDAGGAQIGIRANTDQDTFFNAGNVVVGSATALARFHVTGGDGRILAPSGDFTESLTISGVPVSTGNGDGEPAFVSDARLKDDIYPIDDPIEKISQLQGVNFTWNDKSPDAVQGAPDIGVIAQSVQKIMPEAITTNPDGYLSVYYYKLIPLLIETVKEQEIRISDLEKRINNG